MERISAAELLMQFGIDPNVVITPDGKLHTPEGEDFVFSMSGFGGSSSSSEGDTSPGSDESESARTESEGFSMAKADKSKVLRKKFEKKIKERVLAGRGQTLPVKGVS